jgi:hypothetical protein
MKINEIINLEVLNLNTNKLFERLPNYKEPFAQSTSNGERPGDDQVTIFIGKNAKGYNMKAQKLAQDMESQGYKRSQIWDKTGTYRNQNGDWRQEISDKEFKIKQREFKDQETYKFSDVFDHPELYKAYPFLKDYTIQIDSNLGSLGSWNAYKKLMRIRPDQLSRIVAVHELQHAVQAVEKPKDVTFDGDDNFTSKAIQKAIPDMSNWDVYTAYHTEMDAFSAEDRIDFDDWQRQQNIPTNNTTKYVTIQDKPNTGPWHPGTVHHTNVIFPGEKFGQSTWNPQKTFDNPYYGLSPEQWDDVDPMQFDYNLIARGNAGTKTMKKHVGHDKDDFKHDAGSHSHPNQQTPTVSKPTLRPNQQTPTVSKPKLRPTNLGKQNKIDQKSGAGTYNYEN